MPGTAMSRWWSRERDRRGDRATHRGLKHHRPSKDQERRTSILASTQATKLHNLLKIINDKPCTLTKTHANTTNMFGKVTKEHKLLFTIVGLLVNAATYGCMAAGKSPSLRTWAAAYAERRSVCDA